MKITQHNTDSLNATITLNIEKEDYASRLKKSLNDYRRKVDIKGFRPGMAPLGLIEKKYGGPILVEEVQRIISESMDKYIKENNLSLLGELLPHEDEYQKINWDVPGDMEFKFDVGLAPDIDIQFTEKDKIPFYKIKVTPEILNQYKESVRRQHGKLVDVDETAEEDVIKATLTQGDHTIENSYILLKTIEDTKLKKPFLGKKAGDEFDADLKKTFTDEATLASLLNVKQEELAKFEPVFHITVNEVKRFVPAEINQELYDNAFGKDEVKNEEEFDKRAEAHIAGGYEEESEHRFAVDAREEALKKAKLELPESFLKRWLLYSNKGEFTPEQVEKEFSDFADNLRWKLICEHITKTQALQITEEDLLKQALRMTRHQFSLYGLHNASNEQLEHFAKNILTNEQEVKRVYEKAGEGKVIDYIKSVVKLDEKEITIEKLEQLYEGK
jgi:trigger factor